MLPLQYVEIHSVFVRGLLGQMTVWAAKKPIKSNQSSNASVITFGMIEHATMQMERYHKQEEWVKVFDSVCEPSPRALVELPLDEPIRIERGEMIGIYVHSAERGDQGIVYDNTGELGARPKRDGRITIHPGVAHLSMKPFGKSAPWGGASLRPNRQFVGKLGYAVRWMRWNENVHKMFPCGYRDAVVELIKGNRDENCALSILPPEIIFAMLNKSVGWDWFNAQMRRRKPRLDGKPLFPRIQYSVTCGHTMVDQFLDLPRVSSHQLPQYSRRAKKIFKHLMYEEYTSKPLQRLETLKLTVDDDNVEKEDGDDKDDVEKESESESLDGDYVSDEDSPKAEADAEDGDNAPPKAAAAGGGEEKRKTRAQKKKEEESKKKKKISLEDKVREDIRSRYSRIMHLDRPVIELLINHTFDSIIRELMELDLLVEEGIASSHDDVDSFLTAYQLNPLRSNGGHPSRTSVTEALLYVNDVESIEFVGDTEGELQTKSIIGNEKMAPSIINKFEQNYNHASGNHFWYNAHGPSLAGGFQDDDDDDDDDDDEEDWEDEEDIEDEEEYFEEDEFEEDWEHEEHESEGPMTHNIEYDDDEAVFSHSDEEMG